MSASPRRSEDAVVAAERRVAQQTVPGAYRVFVPRAGDYLVVQLPGERIRCPIERVINTDTVIFRIDSPPMAKTHQFQFEQNYGARRRLLNGRDFWEAQYEREFLAEQARVTEAGRLRTVPVAVPETKIVPTATGSHKATQEKGVTKSVEKPKAKKKAAKR